MRHDQPSVRSAGGAGRKRRADAVARTADGYGQGRGARSLRPLDRRARLAHPGGDREATRSIRAASSPCAAPATSSRASRTTRNEAPAGHAQQPVREGLSDAAGEPRRGGGRQRDIRAPWPGRAGPRLGRPARRFPCRDAAAGRRSAHRSKARSTVSPTLSTPTSPCTMPDGRLIAGRGRAASR